MVDPGAGGGDLRAESCEDGLGLGGVGLRGVGV